MIITIKRERFREIRQPILSISPIPPDLMLNGGWLAGIKSPYGPELGIRNMKFKLDGLTGSL